MDDRQLLREFVLHRSQPAFAELVRRHVDLVYSAARRQVFDPATAEDVTQSVFVLLAQKAHTVRDSEALPGWLLVTTRFVALNTLRAEARRRRHEFEAGAMNTRKHAEASWDAIAPMLDQAVADLKRQDRDAITLRYFKGNSVAKVAVAMGISEMAAQKRVNRAVEKLRSFFARHGVTTSAAALCSTLTANAMSPAPPQLSIAIGTSALTTTKAAAIVTTAAYTKLAIGVAIVALAGIAVPVVYRATVQQVTAKADSDWRPRVNEVYGLPAGQNVKRVPRPFIPERLDAYRSQATPPSKDNAECLIFTWDGERAEWQNAWYDPIDVGDVLRAVGGIWVQDCDIPREMISVRLDSDWVYRRGATPQEKAVDLSWALSDVIGAETVLKLVPTERDVIVVRGKLEFVPQPEKFPTIVLFAGAMPPDHGWNLQIAQTPDELLQNIGEVIGRPMVNEAELGEKQAAAVAACDFDRLRRSVQTPDDATVDAILANVTKHTALKFTRERRMVPTWRLLKAGDQPANP